MTRHIVDSDVDSDVAAFDARSLGGAMDIAIAAKRHPKMLVVNNECSELPDDWIIGYRSDGMPTAVNYNYHGQMVWAEPRVYIQVKKPRIGCLFWFTIDKETLGVSCRIWSYAGKMQSMPARDLVPFGRVLRFQSDRMVLVS